MAARAPACVVGLRRRRTRVVGAVDVDDDELEVGRRVGVRAGGRGRLVQHDRAVDALIAQALEGAGERVGVAPSVTTVRA